MSNNKQYTDFNDLAAAAGLNEVAQQIKHALTNQVIITQAANDADDEQGK